MGVSIWEGSKAERAVNALEKIAIAQAGNITFANFVQIQELVKQGRASDYFKVGDQINVPWKNTSGTDYTLPFDVVNIGDVTVEGSDTAIPGLWLQSHYAMEGIQFDASEAIYYCSDALAAGTYSFTIGTNWGSNCVSGDVFNFTTTQDIPAGGQIVIGKQADFYTWGAPDTATSNWYAWTFATKGAASALEGPLALSSGEAGTSLGTLSSSTAFGTTGMNNLQRAAYGYNRWSQSAMRQWLNSAADAGEWWTAKNNYDRPPQQLSSLNGFMSGFNADFLAALGRVKTTTALNTVTDSNIGTSEDTYDKFFLASLEQEYIAPQLSGVEGSYWPYWKDRLELSSPQATGSAGANVNHIRYAYNSRTSAQTCRLRSALRGSANYAWFVSTSGYASNSNATSALRGCPACVIC